jgi:CubicO group peptidase (beta-lactamase class C family)
METAMTAGLIDESGNLHLPLATALLALTIAACPAPATRAETVDSSIDSVFAKYSASTPGCAVGVERAGQPVLVRAYGAADLEHGVPNRVDTVFEAGSVSKQFTAASILLLAQDGRLSLQDPVRKYIPELPYYSGPITVAELLGHTSGLRDWGGVEDIAGWPRGDRVYSMDEVLHVAARQGALNYMPGSAWSYTNTGYNLLAIIVERVSGKKLPAFSRERIFVPLGMTHSQWRDDFRRLVRDRAIAYSAGAAGYQQNMPFEDAIGNGGLLTTVGDLLTWNRALSQGALGPFVRSELERRSTLNDGRAVNYARGLFIQRYRGFAEISHAGATAGYRAWLGRYPAQNLSIALLCNAADARTTDLAHAVADRYLSGAPSPAAVAREPSLAKWAGLYANDRAGAPMTLTWRTDHLESEDGATLDTAPGGGFRLGNTSVTLLPGDRFQLDQTGDLITFKRVDSYAPTRAELQSVVGHYRSSEAEAAFIVALDGDRLRFTVEDRPEATGLLRPVYKDAFLGPQGLVRLVFDPGGTVIALRLSNDRVWDLRAEREPSLHPNN